MIINFTNGSQKKLLIKDTSFTTDVSYTGILIDVKDSGTGTTTSTENSFIPLGFGVKQLGIADYKKVIQTLQGYVEGEVAHIENIMAREYKEKATRKLLRSENTTTTSSETEKEKLSDTTTASRFEMQSEVASVLQEAKDASAQANLTYSPPTTGLTISGGVGFASHSSKEESNRQAITQAKDITERALERVVNKVKKERIEKIVEEFEENNKHGFDNTKGDKHVVGVYRWVDKVYKNQVINYGKRLMFEFMVPEPAKLHLLGMTENKSFNGAVLIKPTDPRTFVDSKNAFIKFQLTDFNSLNEITLKYWGSQLNVELKPKLNDFMNISHSFNDESVGIDSDGYGRWTGAFSNNDMKIPENYEAIQITGRVDVGPGVYSSGVSPSGRTFICGQQIGNDVNLQLNNIKDKITISGMYWDVKAISGSLVAKCKLSQEYIQQWQQETFKLIIDAYETAMIKYNQALAEENTKGNLIKETNPSFYRQIENMVLRKNCISYIIDHSPKAVKTYGLAMSNDKNTFSEYEINTTAALDDYTSFAKFIEQAFEWDIMSYNFYPYYWGNKNDWAQLYQYDNNDPLFRSFMQSGMALVVVTVRPGFER